MFASSEGASAAELGIEALCVVWSGVRPPSSCLSPRGRPRLSLRSRNSLTHVIGQLHEAEAQLAQVSEERDRGKAEAARLRRELNAAFDASSKKMMDVAMAASVQALSDEAQHQRRALAEQAILCDEVRGAAPSSRIDGRDRTI